MKNLMSVLLFFGFLQDVGAQLTKQLQEDFAAGKVLLINHTKEVKKEVSGNSIELLTSETIKQFGLCSFAPQGRTEIGAAFVFDEVSICYGRVLIADVASTAKNVTYNVAAPKELQNATVIIKEEGREVLTIPFMDIHNINSGATKAKDAYTQLKALCHFNDGKAITATIKFPEGVSIDNSTYRHFLWLRLNGSETAKIANV